MKMRYAWFRLHGIFVCYNGHCVRLRDYRVKHFLMWYGWEMWRTTGWCSISYSLLSFHNVHDVTRKEVLVTSENKNVNEQWWCVWYWLLVKTTVTFPLFHWSTFGTLSLDFQLGCCEASQMWYWLSTSMIHYTRQSYKLLRQGSIVIPDVLPLSGQAIIGLMVVVWTWLWPFDQNKVT